MKNIATPRTLLTGMSEPQWQKQVVKAAESMGWDWMHPGKAHHLGRQWFTPLEGTLGKGWPDLTLVRSGRMVLAELKTTKGRLRPEQRVVLGLLMEYFNRPGSTISVYLWTPDQWLDVVGVLR